MKRTMIVLVILLTLLSGCTLAPDYQRPAAPVPPAWQDTTELLSPAAALPWQKFFVEEQLQQLIELALANNRDLRIAALNVERAQAQYRISRAELLPQLDATAGYSAKRTPADLTSSGNPEISRQYSVGLGLSAYEVDLFGRVRSLKAQALEQYLASDESRRSVQISLVAQVAVGWLTLAADTQQQQLAIETQANRQRAFELLESRYQAGVSSGLDLQQAKGALAAARVASARYRNLVAQDRNLLQQLVGAPLPQQLQPESLPQALAAVSVLNPGLNSEVLLQRPDILAAEHLLRGANANIGAARANFFPRITLVSSIGTGSDQLSGLFQDGSLAWNFAPGVTLPLFTGGSNKAALAVAKVDRELAVTRYEQAIQTAFREVADGLARQTTIDEQFAAQQQLTDANAESYRLASVRYQQGVDSYLNVLDAQRSLYAARQQLIATRLEQLANLVTLYKALGGGAG